MPTNDLHRACGGTDFSQWRGTVQHDPDWGRAGALLGLGEGADPHPDAKRLCAEKDSRGMLPLQLALKKYSGAPEGVVLAIIDAHPQVRRHAESRRTKEFSPLGPRAAVSWPWVLAWGSLEPSRRGAQKAGKSGEKWARYGLKRVKEEESPGARAPLLSRHRVALPPNPRRR